MAKAIPTNPNQLSSRAKAQVTLRESFFRDPKVAVIWVAQAINPAPPIPKPKLKKNQKSVGLTACASRRAGKRAKQTISIANQIPKQKKKSFLARSFISKAMESERVEI
ncbi:MAG: hypothetical protein HC772_08590 [Leptolyngbyaceae cyanobacterium CRU_2_3]|nr:hypothetical protein [Leptolyngbyaceae cyanobacterium CRU_2_3]